MSAAATFFLSSTAERENAMRAVFLAGVDAEKPMAVKVWKPKDARSLQQNATFHMWVGEIAAQTGCTPAIVKDALKREFLNVKEATVNGLPGEDVPSTASLKKDEMTDFLTRVEAWAVEWGIALSHPAELHEKRRYAA